MLFASCLRPLSVPSVVRHTYNTHVPYVVRHTYNTLPNRFKGIILCTLLLQVAENSFNHGDKL